MGRAPCCDKENVKKGPWSPEEDAKLKSYIEQNGTGGNWIALPQKVGLKRCGKSCRLRWLNYLRPNLKHGAFSEEEENIICSLYIRIGSSQSLYRSFFSLKSLQESSSAALSVPATRPSTMLPSAAKVRRKILFRKAKIAEETKRYDHMVQFMKEIVEATNPATDLSPKERCLLGVAFKNFVTQPRHAHLSAAAKTRSWLNHFAGPLAASYLLTSRMEISSACTEIVQLIDCRLLPSAVSKESKVFYLTLKGDVSWYMAEVKGAFDGMGDAGVANSAYAEAWGMVTELGLMNPHRLAFEVSVAEHFFNFRNSPVDAFAAVDRALSISAISSPETSPAVSLLTFEGGVQLTANLLSLKHRLQHVLQSTAAGPSNLPAENAAGGNAAGNP